MKIEQVAYGARDIDAAIKQYNDKLGLNEWIHDEVTAVGEVLGKPAKNKARLAFNYELGFELELLQYIEGDNWHNNLGWEVTQSGIWLSHMGYHCKDIHEEKLRYSFPIAQEIVTTLHTNPVAMARRYHYVVFNSRATLGFDLKLIQRLNHAQS